MIGNVLTIFAALALLGLGIGAWLAPMPSARGYGLATQDGTALSYVRAAGARDLVFGLILLALLASGARSALAVTILTLTIVGASDFWLVRCGRRPQFAPALLVHGAGTIGLPVLAAIVFSGV